MLMHAVQKPVFNVSNPFQGIVTITTNIPFVSLLSNFIDEIEGDLEPELFAFQTQLRRALDRCER